MFTEPAAVFCLESSTHTLPSITVLHPVFMRNVIVLTLCVKASLCSALQTTPADFRSVNPHHLHQHWQKSPFLERNAHNYVFNTRDLRRVIDENFLDAGKGTFDFGRSGWKIAAVSKPMGHTFEQAKLHYGDVLRALQEPNGQ